MAKELKLRDWLNEEKMQEMRKDLEKGNFHIYHFFIENSEEDLPVEINDLTETTVRQYYHLDGEVKTGTYAGSQVHIQYNTRKREGTISLFEQSS